MLEAIKNTIFGGYHYPCKGNKFTLTEDSKSAKCKEAKFEVKDGDQYLVFKFDPSKKIKRDGNNIKQLFSFFEEGEYQSICDYIIFYKKSKGDLFAIICNLKSDNIGNNVIQINAGEIFADFIYKTAKRISPDNFTSKKLKIVKVLFSSIRHYSEGKNNQSGIINYLSNSETSRTMLLYNNCHNEITRR